MDDVTKLARLAKVLDAKMRRDQMQVQLARAEVAAIAGQIADLRQSNPSLGDMPEALLNGEKHRQWKRSKIRELSIKLAAARAVESEGLDVLRVAFGKHAALGKLASQIDKSP